MDRAGWAPRSLRQGRVPGPRQGRYARLPRPRRSSVGASTRRWIGR